MERVLTMKRGEIDVREGASSGSCITFAFLFQQLLPAGMSFILCPKSCPVCLLSPAGSLPWLYQGLDLRGDQ